MPKRSNPTNPRHAGNPDHAALLEAIATALNNAQGAGLRVRLKHNTVWTRAGYVLPLLENAWCARTLAYTQFPAAPDDEDE